MGVRLGGWVDLVRGFLRCRRTAVPGVSAARLRERAFGRIVSVVVAVVHGPRYADAAAPAPLQSRRTIRCVPAGLDGHGLPGAGGLGSPAPAGNAGHCFSALARFWISATVAESSEETLTANPLPVEATFAFTPLSSSGQ